MTGPTLAVQVPNPKRSVEWSERLAAAVPGWKVYSAEALAEQHVDPSSVDYVVVWRPQPGWIAQFANLKATVSIGAGVDHVLADPDYPRQVPIIKTIGADLTQRMREYIALQVLRLHRCQGELDRRQQERHWRALVVPPANERVVGVMGLGVLGHAAVETLIGLGFDVRGWSRSGASIQGMQSFAGKDQLSDFLRGCEILVCLLPLTSDTQGVLDTTLFEQLEPGAMLVNAARGEHLNESELLEALESGQLSAATLDVFQMEPLPEDHPFWVHPKITVTPHIASIIDPLTGVRIIAENLQAFERDGRVEHMAKVGRGY